MYSIIAYIIIFILLCFLVLHGYQKVKSQFCKTQPVFHYYDHCYYFYKPGPEPTKGPEPTSRSGQL